MPQLVTAPLISLQEFLLRLTPWQAFKLFGVALISAVILIYLGWGEPLLPSVPVALYGLVLYYCQAWLFVQLSPTVQDSPYFLGFLLTLLGLFRILNSPALISTDRAEVIRGVASAILTTVVGLFMRQLVSSRDPTEEAYDAKFRQLADEIRKDTVEFHNAQKLFVDLVTEFTKTREELMSREEKAFAGYVEDLQAGATILSRIQQQYPKKVETLLDSIDECASKLKERLEQVESRFSLAATSYVEQFDQERKLLTEASHGFNYQLSGLRVALSEAMTTFKQHADGLGGLAGFYSKVGTDLAGSMTELAQEIRNAHSNLIGGLAGFYSKVGTDLAGSVTELAQEIRDAHSNLIGGLAGLYSKAGTDLTSSVTDFAQEIRNAHSNLTGLASDLKLASADIKSIDSIIDDLIQLLNKKLASLENGA